MQKFLAQGFFARMRIALSQAVGGALSFQYDKTDKPSKSNRASLERNGALFDFCSASFNQEKRTDNYMFLSFAVDSDSSRRSFNDDFLTDKFVERNIFAGI